MALVKRECLEKIRQTVSIVDVVSPYVRLKRAGSSLKGLSPFTEEKTPSFFVNPSKNVFKCFSSGYAGDIFQFVQLKENLSFNEAIEFLAERFGIALEYESSFVRDTNSTVSLRKELFNLYEVVNQHFKDCFWHEKHPLSQQVRSYWSETRKFSFETAKKFEIGLAPLKADALWSHLSSKNFNLNVLKQSGLFYGSHDSTIKPLHARFQGRLMIPIKDIQGRVIAFSGRQLPFAAAPMDPAKEAKYINSPETPLFSKGQVLFNLDTARQYVDKIPYMFLVEGQLDALRCYEKGLKTAVAPQGTGITENQLKLIQRYDNPLICFLDGDVAGQKAGLRLFEMALKIGLSVRFWILEKEKDPDAFLLNYDGEVSIGKIESFWVHPVTFLVRVYQKLENVREKANAKIIETLFTALAHSESALTTNEFLRQLSLELGLPLKALELDFEKFSKKVFGTRFGPVTSRDNVLDLQKMMHTAEAQLLMLLMNCKGTLKKVIGQVDENWLTVESTCGLLLQKVIFEIKENNIEEISKIPSWEFTEEEKKIWFLLLSENLKIENPKEMLELCLKQIYKKFLKKQILDVDKQLANSSIQKDSKEFNALKMERLRLKQALATEHRFQVEID